MSIYDFNKLLAHNNLNNKSELRKLIHVRIEPGETCNFQCNFCITQNPERLSVIKQKGYDGSNRKMDKDRLLDLLDELKEIGVKAISIVSVGEPLIYPYIDKVIDKAIRLKFDLGITSNFAMKIKDDLIDNLVQFKWLRWSMNGGSKEVYLKTNNPKGVAGKSAYERVQENIARIVKKRDEINSQARINASYVVSKWNNADIKNAYDLANKLKINHIAFRPDSLLMDGRNNKKLDAISSNIDEFKKIKFDDDRITSFSVEGEKENDTLFSKDKDLICFYSNHSIYIAANGDVYPCCYTRMDKKYVIGNIANEDFKTFWKNPKNAEYYKKLIVNTCPSCPYTSLNEELKKVYNDEETDFSRHQNVDVSSINFV